jgi:hypothetical protein
MELLCFAPPLSPPPAGGRSDNTNNALLVPSIPHERGGGVTADEGV